MRRSRIFPKQSRERKELETAKKNEEMEAPFSLIQEKGLTIEEAKEYISELANEKNEWLKPPAPDNPYLQLIYI